jgi:hypothetical protein
MSNAAYRPSGSSDDPRSIGLLSGSMVAALVAFVFGTCLFVALDTMHRRQPVESSIVVSSLAVSPVATRATDPF